MYGESNSPVLQCFILLAIVIASFAINYCPNNMRALLNHGKPVLTPDLARYVITPRYGYQKSIEKWNFFYHDETGIDWSFCEKDLYWSENSQYVISPKAEA